MLVRGKSIQSVLIFVGKARAYLSKSSFRFSTPGLTFKHYTRLERLVRDKHTSLLRTFVNYGRKFFITWTPGAGAIVIKLFADVSYELS